MSDFQENFFRCYHHATRALNRGDYPTSAKWMSLAQQHLAAAQRYEDLLGQRHRPKKRKTWPKLPASPGRSRKREL